MKASGCIVTYNVISSPSKKKIFLREVEDLLRFTEPDFKLFIVDNASPDGTGEYLKKEYITKSNIEVIANTENIGFGKAHNQIMDKLDSDYHFIINPDILIKDDVIGKMCKFMEQKPECGMVSPDIRFPNGNRQVLAKKNPKIKYLVASRLSSDRENNKLLREYAMLDSDLSVPQQVENASGCFMGIRTSVFKELGGFDDRFFMYFEDFDLARRLNKIAELWYCPDAVVYHEWGRDSKRNTKLMIIHIKSTLKYFLKWGL